MILLTYILLLQIFLTKLLSSSQFWNINGSLPQSVNTSCRYADTANLFSFHKFFVYVSWNIFFVLSE